MKNATQLRASDGASFVVRNEGTALFEVVPVLKSWPTWIFLSLNDIRTKYRRALLGPWWVVLGMGITMTLMALLWSIIFNLDWRHYLPYLMSGIICWQWMQSSVVQSCDIFANDFGNLIRSLPTPPLMHALRFVMRGFWLFLHYLPIWFVSALITNTWPASSAVLLFPIGVAFILVNSLSLSILFGMAGARFRDLSPAVAAVMAPMMLLTPVMWRPEMLGSYQIIATLNPFTHFLALVREPLIGNVPSALNFGMVVVWTAITTSLAIWCYHKYRRVLVLWV